MVGFGAGGAFGAFETAEVDVVVWCTAGIAGGWVDAAAGSALVVGCARDAVGFCVEGWAGMAEIWVGGEAFSVDAE